jgi:hypothetical protein
MKTFKQFIKEDGVGMAAGMVAVNAVGAGNVQGIGFGPNDEPGGRKAVMNKMLKRKSPNVGSKVSS